jgi:hypothetical protein
MKGQSIEYSAGISYTTYFDHQEAYDEYYSAYNSGYGYSFGISIADIKIDSSYLPIVSLTFYNYKGKIYKDNYGLGSGIVTQIEADNYNIGLEIYPVHIKIEKKIRFRLGGEISYLIKENTNGNKISRSGGNFDTTSTALFNKLNVGIIASVGYEVRLKNNWSIIPQYLFYLRLTNEFPDDSPANTKLYRHSIEIAFKKRF